MSEVAAIIIAVNTRLPRRFIPPFRISPKDLMIAMQLIPKAIHSIIFMRLVLRCGLTPELSHVGPKAVNREAEQNALPGVG